MENVLTQFCKGPSSGTLAPFEKFWSIGKEEARTGWKNMYRGHQKATR